MVRKKIAVFSGFYLPFLGGVERYTNKLTAQLASLGYDIVIVTTNHAALADYEKTGHITIYRLPSRKISKNRYPILKPGSEYKKLLAKVEQEKVDYVICNTRFQLTTLLGVKFARRLGLQPIVIDHGSSHMSVSSKALDFFGAIYEHVLTGIIKRYKPLFFGVSERSSDWLKHFRIKSSGVFYNAVDDDTYEKFKSQHYAKKFPGKIVITYAGRIIKEKGIEVLLEAFVKLREKHDDVVLVVAGDGPLLPSLIQRYTDKQIYFEGKLDYQDMMRLFNDTDIFCNPSQYPEGLPTSILEAGIMKSAVIATDRGGTKEVIIGPKYGMIIAESEVGLRSALKRLIDNPDLIKSMKNNLHQRIIANFTWSKTAAEVDRVLRNMDNAKS